MDAGARATQEQLSRLHRGRSCASMRPRHLDILSIVNEHFEFHVGAANAR